MSKKIKEITESGIKQFISPHQNFTLAIQDGAQKRKFKFEDGKYETSDPEESALIFAEFERRYKKGEDENGDPQYIGDMKFLPVNEYQKNRLKTPVQVKVNGKIYEVTEQDLIEMIQEKEKHAPKSDSGEPGHNTEVITEKPVKTKGKKVTGKIKA